MNNAEKFAEVFGIDLPIKIHCSHAPDEKCKHCQHRIECDKWALEEYKEPEVKEEYKEPEIIFEGKIFEVNTVNKNGITYPSVSVIEAAKQQYLKIIDKKYHDQVRKELDKFLDRSISESVIRELIKDIKAEKRMNEYNGFMIANISIDKVIKMIYEKCEINDENDCNN